MVIILPCQLVICHNENEALLLVDIRQNLVWSNRLSEKFNMKCPGRDMSEDWRHQVLKILS